MSPHDLSRATILMILALIVRPLIDVMLSACPGSRAGEWLDGGGSVSASAHRAVQRACGQGQDGHHRTGVRPLRPPR